MKYLLLIIGWALLSLVLIVERSFKIIISIIIILWAFKFIKSNHSFHKGIHVVVPIIIFPVIYEFKTLKDYYLLNGKMMTD